MMDTIKWVFFDIGSTLVDESTAYKNRIKRTIANTDVSYNSNYKSHPEYNRDRIFLFQESIAMFTKLYVFFNGI